MRWYQNQNIMNCTGIPSVCVSPMWPNIMNINDCKTWQLSATRYRPVHVVVTHLQITCMKRHGMNEIFNNSVSIVIIVTVLFIIM